MTKEKALQISARAWCHPETQNIPMNPELCEAFARILMEETNVRKPRFGEENPDKFYGCYG